MKNYVMRLLLTLYTYGIDFIAPSYCAYCRIFLSTRAVYCTTCTELIRTLVSIAVPLINNYELTVLAACDYKEPLKSLILAKTWSDATASKRLAHVIWQHSALKNITFDFLVPVPLHWTRKARRGYNQAALIAHELSILSGKPVVQCIKRIKRTRFQALLSALARKQNVSDAFVLDVKDKAAYENKTFMLVDDLMTTGSTLQALGKVLVQLKPQKIYAVVACRVASV